ncbi:unnamed protein product [Cladocopium goreaui]|uniref:Periaxin n=1 Tax=Cladocopium goreaui TaxID=2562237 RepID=A0A9P1GG23_9DINO|nr:unnamed protein product [Cladocopium goreaui]
MPRFDMNNMLGEAPPLDFGRRGRRILASFQEKSGPELEAACAKERQKEQDIEDESKEASADVLAYSAREHAIHEAWKHAEKANELSKESAEAALEAANESMEARRILDQHDIIAIENQTQADVAKAEAVQGLESHSAWPLAALSAPIEKWRCRGLLGSHQGRKLHLSSFL